MAARKPRIEYYWIGAHKLGGLVDYFVNWRLIGANGEIMCQSTQGFRDKADARRAVVAVSVVMGGPGADGGDLRETGPGRKPA